MDIDDMTTEAERIALECGKLLEGKGYAVQGCALLDLYSTFLSGVPLHARIDELDRMRKLVLKLAKIKAEERDRCALKK